MKKDKTKNLPALLLASAVTVGGAAATLNEKLGERQLQLQLEGRIKYNYKHKDKHSKNINTPEM